MSVSLRSEFDLFAPRPIQTFVVETTEVTYKPIASVEQSDLEFLIPADNDTYVYLNIILYIRSKLTKAVGTNLDNTDCDYNPGFGTQKVSKAFGDHIDVKQ